MRNFLFQFLLPLLVLIAALLNWSLVSLLDLVAFLLIHLDVSQNGYHFRRWLLLLWLIISSSVLIILCQATFLLVLAARGGEWTAEIFWWADLVGLMRLQSWKSPVVIYFLVVQVLVVFVALLCLYGSRLGWPSRESYISTRFSDITDHLGSNLRVISCLFLPAIQLVVGISHPSWISLPFFLGSSAGLVDWSLTSNFLGLFRWWSLLRVYAGFNIVILYIYQLPIELPKLIKQISDFIGLFKISTHSEWPQICSGVSLLVFYIMLSYIRCDLIKMNLIVSMKGNDLPEELLPSRHSFFIRESRLMKNEESQGVLSGLSSQTSKIKKNLTQGTIARQFLDATNTKVQEILSTSASSVSMNVVENEVFQQLMHGNIIPKRPIGYGLGVKASAVYGVQGLLWSGNSSEIQDNHFNIGFGTLMKQNEELRKKNASLEAKFDQNQQLLLQVLAELRNMKDGPRGLDVDQPNSQHRSSQVPDASSKYSLHE